VTFLFHVIIISDDDDNDDYDVYEIIIFSALLKEFLYILSRSSLHEFGVM
jgi:hypothetical protein